MDGQTDTTKLIDVFRDFAKAPKNSVFDVFRFWAYMALSESKIVTNLDSDFLEVPLLCGTELDDYRAGILNRD